MTAHRVRAPMRWVAACAVGAAAALAAIGTVAAPAAAAEDPVVDGHLDWGFKASFRAYVSAGNGDPPIATSDGATVNSDGTFRFPVTGGSYDDQTGAITVHHGGSVVFSYPAHFFEITLANPTVVVDGGNASLLADVDLEVSGGGFEPVHVVQVEIASLDPAATDPVGTGGTVTWDGLPATLTETGAGAFAGFYTAGTVLDPASFAFSTDGTVAVPTVTVLPATGLDPAGATIEVSGSGFDPTEPGIYVAFGPQDGDEWWTDAGRFQTATWVHASGTPGGSQDTMAPDGSFSTTLDVSAVYTDGNGDQVDCTAVQCYVLTMRAHGLPDRGQDTATPVGFGDTPPAGGTAEQQLTVEVAGGPLTLAVSGDPVTLAGATVGGTATGSLHPATVQDLRGTGAGWGLVGQVSDFTGEAGAIGGDQLGWTPAAAAGGGGGTVAAGDPAGSGLDIAHTLCAAERGASAGTFQCGADLTLSIPESTAPGTYTATLTITLA